MRSVVGRRLRKMFKEKLQEAYPQFEQVKKAEIPPGDRLFHWQMSRQFDIYIELCLDHRLDQFTIEGAWSRKGRFPQLGTMLPHGVPRLGMSPDEPKDGEFRFRLASLWNPGKDTWWKVTTERLPSEMSLDELSRPTLPEDYMNPPDVADELIQEKVDEVISAIREYAIPYFEEANRCWGTTES